MSYLYQFKNMFIGWCFSTENYDDFKAQVAEFLPVIYDTKYMTVRCRKNLDHPALKDSKKDIDYLRCSGLYMIYTSSSNAAGEMDKFPPKIVLSETCQNFSEGKTKIKLS